MIRTYDSNYESSDIALSTSYEDKYTQYDTNPYTGLAWTWNEIDSLQAGASGQKSGNVATSMTAVWVVVNYSPPGSNELDVNGTFSIDVSTYLLAYIQSIEIQLRYRANDTFEKWYLKAYNWTASDYSGSGLNDTSGHTPTTGWDVYAVNLTDKWRSYVSDSGTLYVKLQDSQADVNSTNHQRYDINIYINSGDTESYIRSDISLPDKPYLVKVVTERGNIATHSET